MERFYENLLFCGKHELRNRDMLVEAYKEDIRTLVKEDRVFVEIKRDCT